MNLNDYTKLLTTYKGTGRQNNSLAKFCYEDALESTLGILRIEEPTPGEEFGTAFALGGAVLGERPLGMGVKSLCPEMIDCTGSNPGSSLYWLCDFGKFM